MAKFRIVGISFDHMHMGDLLRCVHDHPDAEIAGIFDPDRSTMQRAIDTFGIPEDRVFTDFDACMKAAKPDLAILCAATADHADYTKHLAAYGVHVFVEKPFAGSVADARAMIEAVKPTGKYLAINWPLRWVESHVTAKRLVDEGMIGEVIEIHSYGGNRGPLYHLADKIEVSREEVERQKPTSWWYKRASAVGAASWTTWATARRWAPGIGAARRRWKSPASPMRRRGSRSTSMPSSSAAMPEGPVQDGNPLGHLHRPLGDPAAAEMRFHPGGHRGHHRQLGLCRPRHRADPRQSRTAPGPCRSAAAGGPQNAIEYVLGCISRGDPLTGPLDPASA
jgi:hypothetical protein